MTFRHIAFSLLIATIIAPMAHAASFSASAEIDWSKVTVRHPYAIPGDPVSLAGVSIDGQSASVLSPRDQNSNGGWNLDGPSRSDPGLVSTQGAAASIIGDPSSGSVRYSAYANDVAPQHAVCQALYLYLCREYGYENRATSGAAAVTLTFSFSDLATYAPTAEVYVPYSLTATVNRTDILDPAAVGFARASLSAWVGGGPIGTAVLADYTAFQEVYTANWIDGSGLTSSGSIRIVADNFAPGDSFYVSLLVSAEAANIAVTPVPEPSEWALMLAGLALVAATVQVRHRAGDRTGGSGPARGPLVIS